ncbi:type VII secretion protein EccCb [Mycobacterium sp. NPDC003323]
MEFVRDRRAAAPEAPSGSVQVRRPPEIARTPPVGPLARLLPVVMLVAAGAMMILYLSADGISTTRSPMYLLFPVLMAVSVLGSLAHGARSGAGDLDANRRDYLRYLDAVADDAARTAAAQRAQRCWTHPDPVTLWTLVGGHRMWERRRADPDFCSVRVGLGPAVLATPLTVPDGDPVGEPDPVTETALDDVLAAWSVVPALPVTVDLDGHLGITGQREAVRALARAIICQVAVLHSPADVRIVARPADGHWDWLKWLPHHGARHGAARTVLVIDDDGPAPEGADTAVLHLGASGDRSLAAGPDTDALTEAQALICARRLARWRAGGPGPDGAPDWAGLLGIDHPGAVRPGRGGRLRVPIGTGADTENRGAPVYLDLKEAAQGGMGPHGLCVGATGSGKSEFLRTLILGLAATHTSDELNLVLIDFKGGATFLGFERVHHVAAVITNLADAAHLVDRMRDALTGEMHRRQQLLRTAGVDSVAHYRRSRTHGDHLPALADLLIVIDEFSELLSRHPDFAEVFVAVGRLGRSLGMHLLLASQRLDEGRLRGLENHLSYRICLKTFSAAESRAVLGVPDAYELPSDPGAAYLKTADGDLVRLRTAYVSGPLTEPPPSGDTPTVQRFTALIQETRAPDPSERTVLGAALDRLAGQGARAHPVWLAPLPAAPALAEMPAADGPPLTTVLGLVDNPFAQRRDGLIVDVNGAGGHVAVVGATRSGKSTALCTLMLGLAARHDPTEIQFYCLDLGGGLLTGLRELPHVGVVAGRSDRELIGRTVASLQHLIRRRMQSGNRYGSDGYGEVFLVVDGWAALRSDGDGLEEAITDIAAHGLAHGVHVVITAARWAELRPALKDQLGTRIELRLGEPGESEMDRRAARRLSDRPPGTALTRDGREAMLALPRLHGPDLASSVAALAAQHPQRRAVPVRLLPAMLPLSTLPSTGCTPSAVVIGIDDSEFRPVTVDFAECGHLLVLGDPGCGKTATLRALCTQLTRAGGPDRVRLYVADVRRTMLGAVGSAHLGGYAISANILQTQVLSLVDTLRARLPGAEVTQQQLRDRSWWTGPEIYLLVDDYELLAGSTDPLAALLEFLPYTRDIGLHVVIARRAGGAARALFNPVPAMMRELGAAGLMMSAGADDGVLLGTARPAVLPPGRAILIRRGHPDERIQVGWTEPP